MECWINKTLGKNGGTFPFISRVPTITVCAGTFLLFRGNLGGLFAASFNRCCHFGLERFVLQILFAVFWAIWYVRFAEWATLCACWWYIICYERPLFIIFCCRPLECKREMLLLILRNMIGFSLREVTKRVPFYFGFMYFGCLFPVVPSAFAKLTLLSSTLSFQINKLQRIVVK